MNKQRKDKDYTMNQHTGVTSRNTQMDILRGLTIILMVLGHCGFPGTHFIYLFHMAVFFFVSGYFYKDACSETVGSMWKYIKHKLKTLWLPYALWNTIFVLLNNWFIRMNVYTDNPALVKAVGEEYAVLHHYMTGTEMLKEIVKNLAFYGGTTMGGALWFLQTLFFVAIAYALIDFLLKKSRIGYKHHMIVQGCIALIFLGVGYWSSVTGITFHAMERVASCYILYYLGLLLRKYEKTEKSTFYRVGKIIIATVVLLVCNKIGAIALNINSYENPLFLLVTSIAGWMLLVETSYFINQIRWLQAGLTVVGQNTLPIVVLHLLSFKLVSVIGVMVEGLPVYMVAAFPVLFYGGAWWVAYTVAGVSLPLLDGIVKNICCRRLLQKERN